MNEEEKSIGQEMHELLLECRTVPSKSEVDITEVASGVREIVKNQKSFTNAAFLLSLEQHCVRDHLSDEEMNRFRGLVEKALTGWVARENHPESNNMFINALNNCAYGTPF